jgi:uncharacterized protein (DUF305 family)
MVVLATSAKCMTEVRIGEWSSLVLSLRHAIRSLLWRRIRRMKRSVAVLIVCSLMAPAAFAQAGMHQGHGMTASMNHDVMFADAMTKHHQDGIKMAQLAVDKSAIAELRSMAQKMIDDQRRDIEQMQSLRGEAPKTPMSQIMSMPGMMSESQMQRDMARLRSASGHDFDLAFTEIMPMHHEGAITMSMDELRNGTNAGLKEIAQKIADAQSRERQQLIAMHETMSAEHGAMTSSSTGRQRMTKD